MIIFLLPKTNIYIYINLNIQTSIDIPTPFISHSLSKYLNESKTQIHYHYLNWDIYKKYTNTYEYIHTIIPKKRNSISKYKPISRSYFKMIELIEEFKFDLDTTNTLHSFHLAEGPGGFIEAVSNYRKKKIIDTSNDMYVGMTLTENNNLYNSDNPPGWKKINHFLKENQNIFIEGGLDGGNILSLSNFIYIYEKYGDTMDFITADGGFDFSTDFNNQEINMAPLLYGQIVFALCMQKKGGSFVLKIFDCFMKHTIELLMLLSSMYEEVYITKPNTSRSANSEKYIVCKRYIYTSVQIYPYLFFSFKEMIEKKATYIDSFFKIKIPLFFIKKIEKYNVFFGEKQLENINQTIDLIEEINNIKVTNNKKVSNYDYCKINTLINNNIVKCIHWCIKHNIPIYTY